MSRKWPGGAVLVRFLPLGIAAVAFGVAAALGPSLLGYDVRPGPLFGPASPKASAVSEGATHSAPGIAQDAVLIEVPSLALAVPLSMRTVDTVPPDSPSDQAGEPEAVPPAPPSATSPPGPTSPVSPPTGPSAAEVDDPGAGPTVPEPSGPGAPPPAPSGGPSGPEPQAHHPDPHANGKGCDDSLFASGGPGTKGGPVGCEVGNSAGHRRNGEGGASGNNASPGNGNAYGRDKGEGGPESQGNGKGKPPEPPGNPDPKGQAKGLGK